MEAGAILTDNLCWGEISTDGAFKVWPWSRRGPSSLGPEQLGWLINQLGNPIFTDSLDSLQAAILASSWRMLHAIDCLQAAGG